MSLCITLKETLATFYTKNQNHSALLYHSQGKLSVVQLTTTRNTALLQGAQQRGTF